VVGCVRSYSFLVSVDHPFHFEAISQRDIGTEYIDYVFYVNGHYDPAKPDESKTKYIGSWKDYRLTNKSVTPPTTGSVGLLPPTTTPVAIFTATPQSGNAPLSVTLDTSGASGTPTWSVIKDGQQLTSLIPPQSTGKIILPSLSEGFYDFRLTTTSVDTLKSEFALLRALLVARSQAGLNQVQVAERMGTKLSTVVRLESALIQGKKYTPSLAMLKKYADAVGCDLDIKLIHRQSMSEGVN
jgi:DNA-binding XRE family transcriptional regulator